MDDVGQLGLSPELAVLVAAELSNIDVGLVVTDGAGRTVGANQAFCDLVGRELGELLGMETFWPLLAPDQRHMVVERLAARSAGDEDHRVRSTVLHTDGRRVPVEYVMVPVDIPGENRRVGFVRDLTEQRTHWLTIERYSALVERMPLGVVLWDADGAIHPADMRLIAANPSAERMLGVDLDALAGRSLRAAIPAAADDDENYRILAVAGTDRVDHLDDAVYGDDRSARRVYRRRAVGLPGHVVAVLFEDVTGERAEAARRRLLLERLVDEQDRQQQQLAMAVHDDPLQQLAAATMLVEALRRRTAQPAAETHLEAIEAALRAVSSSLRERVFELYPPELEESGLGAAVRRAAAYLFDTTTTSAAVDVRAGPDVPASVVQVAYRIIVEALANARKHADATAVEVHAIERGTVLHIQVIDDGRGFDGDLGDPGHLGLQAMRDRTEAAGGALRIHSGDGGTTVTASLPLDAPVPVPVLTPEVVTGAVDDATEPMAALRRERDSLLVALVDSADRAARAERRLSASLDFSETLLSAAKEPARVLPSAARCIASAVPDGCAVFLLTEDRRRLRRHSSYHEDAAQLAFLDECLFFDRLPDEGHIGTVLRSGEGLLLNRGEGAWPPVEYRTPSSLPPHVPHGALVVPLRGDDDVYGVVALVRDRTPEPLTTHDLDLAQRLASRLVLIGALVWGPGIFPGD